MGAILDLIRAPRTSPKAVPQGTATVMHTWDGKVGKADARMYRHWSIHSEWIRGAVNIRRSQVSSAEWDIVPFNKNRPVSTRLQKEVRQFFQRPNPANDSFRSFIEPIVEDIIVLDAGVVEKVRSLTGDLVELWPVDGATIKVNANWDGNPDEPRYFWYPDYKERAQFKTSDMIYMMANRRSNSPVGLSALETLKNTIEAEIMGHTYNTRQVAGAAPDGLLDLGEGMTEPDVRKYRAYFESEVAGRGSIGFIGGSKGAQWIPFRKDNREMQFLEWQIYLVRKMCVVMGLTPQDLGLTFDINKSTSEVQIQISEDRGLRPLMTLLQDYLTQEVIWDDAFGGVENNLCFRFTALNLKESSAKAVINEKALAGVPWRYINEARLEEGREPIPGMEGKLIMETPLGAVDISDVPTVREIVELQAKKKESAPPAASQKDFGPGELIEFATALNSRPVPDVHVDRGAVEVNITQEPPLTDGAIRIDNHSSFTPASEPEPPLEPLRQKSTTYERDEHGQITAKVEVETDLNYPAYRRVIKSTFLFDDEGNVIGKEDRVIE